MTTFAAGYRQRSKDWKAVFWAGVLALVLGLFNVSWRSLTGSQPAPFTPAVVPPSPYVAPTAQQPAPVVVRAPPAPSKIIQSLPPATIAPQIAPTLHSDFDDIERPSPEKKIPQPEFGVQPGYEQPTSPEPQNVR